MKKAAREIDPEWCAVRIFGEVWSKNKQQKVWASTISFFDQFIFVVKFEVTTFIG